MSKITVSLVLVLALCFAQAPWLHARPASMEIDTAIGCVKMALEKCVAPIASKVDPAIRGQLTREQCCLLEKSQNCYWQVIQKETECGELMSDDVVAGGQKASAIMLQTAGCVVNSC